MGQCQELTQRAIIIAARQRTLGRNRCRMRMIVAACVRVLVFVAMPTTIRMRMGRRRCRRMVPICQGAIRMVMSVA